MNFNKKIKNHKCRTCYSATQGFKSLQNLATDEKQLPKSYAELLEEITDIHVMNNKYKELTQYICGSCCRKLKSAYAFIQQAKDVNANLLNLLYQIDNTKPVDLLQEYIVDTCLEIKMEDDVNEGVEEYKKHFCKEEVKLEEPEEYNISILGNTKSCIEKVDIFALPENENGLNSSDIASIGAKINTDLLIVDNTIENTLSSDHEDNNDDYMSDEYNWKQPKTMSNKNNKFKDKSIVKNNIIKDDIAVACNQCNKVFKNSKALTKHQQNAHIKEDQKCSCPVCGIKYTKSYNVYAHMRVFHGPDSVMLKRKISNQERIYQCDKCSKNYTRKKDLNTHIKNKHGNGNNDKSKDKHSSNIQTHENSSLCSICGITLSCKSMLKVHMRRHTGERPFKCDLCDQTFPRNYALTVHRRIHTGEKPFECKICGKSFRVAGKLATHIRSHTDIRPYKCTQCERSFKYSKDLNIHFRIHTGERPYCCNICGSTFAVSNSLKAHRLKLGHGEIAESDLKVQSKTTSLDIP